MVKIEKFRPEDHDALTVMVGRLQELDRQFCAEMKIPGVVADAYTEDMVRLASGRNGAVLVARAPEGLVGCVAGHFREDDDPRVQEDFRIYGQVSDLFVAEPWRMRGVGRMLAAAIETEMRNLGCVVLRFVSKAQNIPAASCMRDSGYAPRDIVLSKILK